MARALLAILIAILAGASSAHAGTTFVGSGITIMTSNQQALNNARIGITAFGWPSYSNGIGICHPYDWRRSLMFRQNGSWYWYGPVYDGLPLIDTVRREDPELMRAIIGPTLPEPDPAMVDLHAGRYGEAAAQFLRRAVKREREETEVESGGGIAIVDRSALRLHALALAGAGDMRGASDAFARAHAEDPLLGGDPIEGDRVLASPSEVRRIVLEGIEFALRDDRPASWALVGYLMQVQGRYDESRAMLERARAIIEP